MIKAAFKHNRPIWVSLFLLAAVSFLVYANTLGHEFVYDDDVQILRNQWIRSPEHIPKYFTGDVWSFFNPGQPKSNYYRPVQLLAYLGLYELAGFDPFAYHLANGLLHVACTLLVFLLARSLVPANWMSITAALLFATHPIHTEAVAWVAASTELLCALFYFASFYLFLQSLEKERKRLAWLAASLVAYFLGLLSKEMALSLPLIVFSYSYLASETAPRWWSALRKAGPYLVCTGVYLLVRLKALGFIAREQNILPVTTSELLLSAVVLVADYLKMLLLPIRMTAYHVFEPTRSPTELSFVGAALLLIGIGALLIRMKQRFPLLAFSGSWILLTLLPVLNPRAVGSNVFTERYLYIPSFGFVFALVLLAKHIRDRWVQQGKSVVWIRPLAWAILFTIMALYSFQTVRRNGDWRTNLTLYESAVRVSPNAPLMHNNLAQALRERGDWEGARRHYQIAIEVNRTNRVAQETDLGNSQIGLATVYLAEGRLPEAERAYREVIARFPNAFAAYIGLADVLFFQKRFEEALEFFNLATQNRPTEEILWHNQGVALLYLGRYEAAAESFHKALEIYPYYVDAWNNLAVAYLKLGRYQEAEEAAQTALHLDPTNRNSRHFLGLIYYERQDWAAAQEQLQRALRDKPADATIPYHLGVIHQQLADCNQAIPYFTQAIRLQPGFVEALYRLAVCERTRGNLAEAQTYLERIRSLLPTHAAARNELGEIYLMQGKRMEARAEFKAALQAQASVEPAARNPRQLKDTKTTPPKR